MRCSKRNDEGQGEDRHAHEASREKLRHYRMVREGDARRTAPHPMAILDTFERPLGSLRISVTDRCNLRCLYCMPEESYAWLPREDILTFEETALLANLFAEHGATKVRLTGGEPLLRRDLETLVAFIAQRPWLEDLALTTNGVLLADHARSLRAAGLQRITVSLDTLQADRFAAMTRRRDLHSVLRGLNAAAEAG